MSSKQRVGGRPRSLKRYPQPVVNDPKNKSPNRTHLSAEDYEALPHVQLEMQRRARLEEQPSRRYINLYALMNKVDRERWLTQAHADLDRWIQNNPGVPLLQRQKKK